MDETMPEIDTAPLDFLMVLLFAIIIIVRFGLSSKKQAILNGLAY